MGTDTIGDQRRSELTEFLRSRRARLKPHDVGLPNGRARRVPGLRREEVAALAGVGVTWYTLFERGVATGVSSSTVSAVARALRLSESERRYVENLLAPNPPSQIDFAPGPLVESFLRDDVAAPAYLCTRHWMVTAWNHAYAAVWDCAPPGGAEWNLVERFFFDPRTRAMFGAGWESTAEALAGMVRAGFAPLIDDARYDALVRCLLADATFARMWERLDVTRPLEVTHAQIISPNVGRFSYSVLNLKVPTSEEGVLVVQVPDDESRESLRRALAARSAST